MPSAALFSQAVFALLVRSGVCGPSFHDVCFTDDIQVARAEQSHMGPDAVSPLSCAQRWRLLLQERRTLLHGEKQMHSQFTASNDTLKQGEKQTHRQLTASNGTLKQGEKQMDRQLTALNGTLKHGEKQMHRQLTASNGTLKQMHGHLAGSNQTFIPEVSKAVSNSMAWITGKSDNKTGVIGKAWKLGDHVQLHGLLQRGEFNGMTGKIVGKSPFVKSGFGTWRIVLDEGKRRIDVDDDHVSVEVLKAGVKLRLKGLKQTQYNGKTGRLISYNNKKKRWAVQLDGEKDKEILVQYANIDMQDVFLQYRTAQDKKKQKEKERQKEITRLLKKARMKRDQREHVEKIEKDTSFLGLHPLQAIAYFILLIVFTFWFNKLYKEAWSHTWGI